MAVDYRNIEKKTDLVEATLLEKFPDCSYSIMITTWMDDTFQVVCQTGSLSEDRHISTIKSFKYRSQEDELSYKEELRYSRDLSFIATLVERPILYRGK